jgi:hypothetical protein
MNRILIAVSAALLTFPIGGMAQSTTQTASLSAPLTAHDVHKLMKSTQNISEYKQLSSYFHQREAVYRAKAANEEITRNQLAQGTTSQYHKTPSPADFAQQAYEWDVSRADKAAIRAEHYDLLVADQTQHDQQVATTSPGKP